MCVTDMIDKSDNNAQSLKVKGWRLHIQSAPLTCTLVISTLHRV